MICPGEMSSLGTQNMLSKTPFPVEETGFLQELLVSRSGARNACDKPGIHSSSKRQRNYENLFRLCGKYMDPRVLP